MKKAQVLEGTWALHDKAERQSVATINRVGR